MTREDMKLVEALKYWCDTNTECGVTHIPSSLLLKVIDRAIKELDRQEADGCKKFNGSNEQDGVIQSRIRERYIRRSKAH